MENIQNSVERSSSANSIPQLDKEHGYFGSASVTIEPSEVYEFCQNQSHVEKVLTNLPRGVKNFLELKLIGSEQIGPDEYRLEWENAKKFSKGKLIFILKGSPLRKGTILTAEAIFKNIKFRDDGPSTLMNIFLKRMKALIETGVLATITGQPSGREELHERKETLH